MKTSGLTNDEIINALGSSGYVLEQEVATILEACGYHVQTNRAYQDPDEGKSREIDVWAARCVLENKDADLSVWVELICECKNISSPFVFLRRSKTASDKVPNPQEFMFPVGEFRKVLRREGNRTTYQLVPAFVGLELQGHHYYYTQESKAVQFCRLIRKDKRWKATHGGIYNALFYPLVKALVSRQKEVKPHFEHSKMVYLFFPIVVLTAEMYSVDSTAAPLEPASISQVTFVREVRAKGINGAFAVDFVRRESLSKFVGVQIEQFVQHVAKIGTEAPQRFFLSEL